MKRGGKNIAYRRELISVLVSVAKDRSLLEEFLEDLLSPQELIDIATRWQIVKQLDQGVSQRDIGKQLRVGVATITRGSRELEHADGGFARTLSYVYPNRKNRKK